MMEDIGLVESVDRFGEGIVVTVADTSDRKLDASFCQPLGVANGHVDETLPGGHILKVINPPPVWCRDFELPVEPVKRARIVRRSTSKRLAALS